MLLEYGADVNSLGSFFQAVPESSEVVQGTESALHVAIKNNNKELTRFLIQNGADINTLHSLGNKKEAAVDMIEELYPHETDHWKTIFGLMGPKSAMK